MGKGRDKRKRAIRRQRAHSPTVGVPPDDFLRGDDLDALVLAPLRPKPHLGSSAIAVPEPVEPEDESEFERMRRI